MELPAPPLGLYRTAALRVPPAPARVAWRAFGAEDEEIELDAGGGASTAERCLTLKRTNLDIVRAFAKLASNASIESHFSPASTFDPDMAALDGHLARLHMDIGELRKRQALGLVSAQLDAETEMRSAAAQRLREAAVLARGRLKAALDLLESLDSEMDAATDAATAVGSAAGGR
ncbi:hypothetical protein M885DRAFT_615599 [Pelagophyceae sp. CCMP2097]|nr:hypothetical protein M885DRAFT_615599 [Pelagophyceae sp. CCMP2097]